MISRCQWCFLTEKGGVCRNMLLTNCEKDCSFDDQTMCPAYTPIESIDREDADVKIFANPMGTWKAAEETNCCYKNDSKTEPDYPDDSPPMPCTDKNFRLEHLNDQIDAMRYAIGFIDRSEGDSKVAFDVISHPSHYTEGRKYEPKDVIRDWGLNFNLGCVVKYISRAGRKDDILQDLKKARQYLDFEIEAITEEQNDRY